MTRLPAPFWGCLAAAFVLRLAGISKGLRSDEIGTVLYASVPLSDIPATIVANDAHPPLSYVFYHFWLQGGHSEAWIRLPGVLVGVAICALVFVLGRRRVGEPLSLTAMWLVAIAPQSILIAQNVRSYVFASFFVLGAVLSFAAIRDRRGVATPGLAAAYVACATLALYSFYLSALVLLALNLYALACWRSEWRALARWSGLQLVVALLYLPWLPSMLRQVGRVSGSIDEPVGFVIAGVYVGGTIRALSGVLGVDEVAFSTESLVATWPRAALYAAAALVVVAFFGVLAAGVQGLRTNAREGSFPGLVLSIVAGVTALTLVAHQVSGLYLVSRYMYMVFLPATFIMAGAIAFVPRDRWRVAVIALVSVVCLGRLIPLYAWTEMDWKTAAANVATQRAAGDALVYIRDPRATYYFPQDMDKVDVGLLLVQTSTGQFVLPPSAASRQLETVPRVWVAVTNTYLHAGLNAAMVSWLDQHGFRRQGRQSFGGLDVVLYERSGPGFRG